MVKLLVKVNKSKKLKVLATSAGIARALTVSLFIGKMK
jgi:hypothetical protein